MERRKNERRKSFKKITRIMRQYWNSIHGLGGEVSETREIPLINDVWCGFTNYIFQAFKKWTRLIAKESFQNEQESADFFFLSNYDRFAHKLRGLNGSKSSYLKPRRECLLKISKLRKYFPSLFPFLNFFLYICSLPAPHSAQIKQVRWKIPQSCRRGSVRHEIYYSNGLRFT